MLVFGLLLSLCALSSAQGNDTASGSGSGSGNGTTSDMVMRNCSDLQCSHGCNETEGGPMCYCPRGYSLDGNMRTCQPCFGGLFGINCASSCNCSDTGNSCDRVTGDCQCNPCYSGTGCETESGSLVCFVQFLEISDKSRTNLADSYGALAYPIPPLDRLRELVATTILEPNSIDLISDVMFEITSRVDVNQGPLVKMSWLMDMNTDRVRTEDILSGLTNSVKLGNLRATYIAQTTADNAYTLVTLNAGVKEE